MAVKIVAKVRFTNLLRELQPLKNSRFFPVFLLSIISGCALEKELPSACVSIDKAVITELCRDYKRKSDESGKKLVLTEHGFNKRDSKAVYLHDQERVVSCKRLISRQCHLIEIRNGVGY